MTWRGLRGRIQHDPLFFECLEGDRLVVVKGSVRRFDGYLWLSVRPITVCVCAREREKEGEGCYPVKWCPITKQPCLTASASASVPTSRFIPWHVTAQQRRANQRLWDKVGQDESVCVCVRECGSVQACPGHLMRILKISNPSGQPTPNRVLHAAEEERERERERKRRRRQQGPAVCVLLVSASRARPIWRFAQPHNVTEPPVTTFIVTNEKSTVVRVRKRFRTRVRKR